MKQTLKKLALIASTFVSVACNATNSPVHQPNVPASPAIAQNPKMPQASDNSRGTPAFKKTSEYELLRNRLLNVWMPMGELTEGFFPYIYRCSAGQPTVGIGTNMIGCNISLSEMPLYTTSGSRLSVSQVRNWMNQTAGRSMGECKRLAKSLGYRGISHADAERLASKEAAVKVDLVHDAMLEKHGMELFDQPLPIQVLILDLAYQRGHNGVFRNAALWKCLKDKDYANAHRYVVCCTNKNRNAIKKALVNLAHGCKQGTDTSTPLATLGRFNIKFHPSELNRHIFLAGNVDYKPKKASLHSDKSLKNTRRHTAPKRRRGRHG